LNIVCRGRCCSLFACVLEGGGVTLRWRRTTKVLLLPKSSTLGKQGPARYRG
jgi:hypothetical protein